METPNYIKTLLTPNGGKRTGRRVWSLDLESVWLPFFTATNLQGDTAIPLDALGAPLRLGYNPDGTVKFGKTGRPVIKVVKPIADSVKLVRENFAANLMAYAEGVAKDNPEGYQALVNASIQAGQPIATRDKDNLSKAIAEAMEADIAKAKAEASKSKAPKQDKVAVTA
jgi:hypothetical protein